ncbi:hypothetical protein [Photobacterium nomapromontoriensis]|uniref:hypothetical protein n=1 Tax=Photobacterium nomapromontoriensis TaxID=2910237 RepID=UPI003D0D299C
MKDRLRLLQQANVISEASASACLRAHALLQTQLGAAIDSEQYQMALTHLARAFDRIRANEPIEQGLDPELLSEITADPAFEAIATLNQNVLTTLALEAVPDSENSYFLSNLLSLHYAMAEKV